MTCIILQILTIAGIFLLFESKTIFAFTLEQWQSFTPLPTRRKSQTPTHWRTKQSLLLATNKAISSGGIGINGTPVSTSSSYLQWRNERDIWKMQTAITTFQRGDERVELHAQLHFGDNAYFEYWNSNQFTKNVERVLFELLVDDSLLILEGGERRVKAPIMASPNDQTLALQYGWDCQASILDYTNSKWVHADLSRQEFVQSGRGGEDGSSSSLPLWKVVSAPMSSSAAAEAVSALLIGPPTLAYTTRYLKRRLFTNLFLPGGSLAFSLRSILWMTVPSPELSVILLDWSSLLEGGGSNPSGLSQVALPILSSLLKFNLPQMRRFLFGQVLVSSSRNNRIRGSSSSEAQDSTWSMLVTKRNDHALEILRNTFQTANANASTTPKSVALLYGSSHCPDLHSKLVAMGFTPTKTTWRTAWSVNESRQDGTVLPALTALLVFYLAVGALDWVGMMGDVSQAIVDTDPIEASVVATLYLIRHVLLYLGLSKFLVDWTNTNNDSAS
jgi:hypothetical protein